MATCATLGQAAGTAAIYAIKNACPDVRTAAQKYIHEIQQTLLDDDCYLLHIQREVPEITRNAKLTASHGDAELLRNGCDRPDDHSSNAWNVSVGDWAEYEASGDDTFHEVRLIFDSNLKRNHLNMVANYPLKGEVYTPPAELVEAFHIEADGKEIFRTTNNYQRLVKIQLPAPARKVKLIIDALRPQTERIFGFEAR